MSWTMWHVYGYGFETDESRISPDRMVAFLKNHRQSLISTESESILTVIDRSDINYETVSEELREHTDCYTYAEIIRGVINAENEIKFGYAGPTDDGEEAVIFEPVYPWQLNEKEKQLSSPDDIQNILAPYIEELYGHPENIIEIDYIFSG